MAEVEALFERMREAAIPAGERLIEAERAIEEGFAERSLDEEGLRQRLADAEEARAELRAMGMDYGSKANKMKLAKEEIAAAAAAGAEDQHGELVRALAD